MSVTRFTAPLYTADIGRVEKNRPIRVIIRDFEYGLEGENDEDRVYVPIGYCSDGTSVPVFLRGILPVWGKYAQAAIVHDLLYATNSLPRKEADEIFRDAILVLGRDIESDAPTMGGRFLAYLAYWAVRLFGSKPYSAGPAEYPLLAARAKARADAKDPDLAPKIVLTLQDLRREDIMRGSRGELGI